MHVSVKAETVHLQTLNWLKFNTFMTKELCELSRVVLMDWKLRFIRSPLGQIWSPIPQIAPSNEGNHFHLVKSEVRGCLEAEIAKKLPIGSTLLQLERPRTNAGALIGCRLVYLDPARLSACVMLQGPVPSPAREEGAKPNPDRNWNTYI